MQLKTKVLYLASVVAFMRPFAQLIYVPSQESVTRDLSATTTLFGLTISIYGLVLGLGQLFLGPLTDRFDGKRIMVVGLLLFSLASLAGFFAGDIAALMIIRAVQALGIAAGVIVGIALISDIVPQTERGRAMGVYEIFNAAGAAVAPTAGAAVALLLGWQFDFLLLTLVGFILVGITVWQLPRQPVKAQRVGLPDMAIILRNPATAGAIILGFVQFYALFTVFTVLPTLLTVDMGMSVGSIGMMVSLLPVGAMLGSLIGGRRADHSRVRNVVIPSSFAAAAGFSILGFLGGQHAEILSPALVGGVVGVSGFAIGYCLPAQLKIMVDHYPGMRGTASGLLIFARFMGTSLAPALTGYLVDEVGVGAGFGSAAVLLSIGALFALFAVTEPDKEPKKGMKVAGLDEPG